MNRPRNKAVSLALVCAVACGLFSGNVHAKELDFRTADKALKAGKWAEAEAAYENVIKPYQTRCGSPMISKFGSIYFKKGWCELKQEKWKEAMTSFEVCYKKFPHTRKHPNPFHCRALLHWADAAMGTKDDKEAAKLYEKYLSESKRRP